MNLALGDVVEQISAVVKIMDPNNTKYPNGIDRIKVRTFFLAQCILSWLPSPEIRAALAYWVLGPMFDRGQDLKNHEFTATWLLDF